MRTLSVAMPAYKNAEQVWWTVEALRMYQGLDNKEIFVVDNYGDADTKKVCSDTKIRYELCNDVNGTGYVRNKIFELAQSDFVLVIDSHVLLYPEAITKLRQWVELNWEDAINLIHGPIVMSALVNAFTHYENKWRADMWGIWPKAVRPSEIPDAPFEIEMMGCGLFGCRRDSWLKFHPDCRGFDGVEGVIHEKYRRAGRKVLCLPFLKWVHKFGNKVQYPLLRSDKIRNFLLGFEEIGMDPAPVYEHFGIKNESAGA
jgi:glycosyltransferase involved in cell wall biosynthesis